jgi:hypothetical protein
MLTTKDFEEKYLNRKFNKLAIIGKSKSEGKHVLYVVALCECGNEKDMLLNNIIYGLSKSCGCGVALAASRMGRNRVKTTINTSDGPKTIADLSREYDVPYTRIMTRYHRGIREVDTLVTDRRIGNKPDIKDVRLNNMSQKEAAEHFGISKQLVSFRLKQGWIVNEENNWVSPTKGRVSGVQKISKRAQKRMRERRNLLQGLKSL